MKTDTLVCPLHRFAADVIAIGAFVHALLSRAYRSVS